MLLVVNPDLIENRHRERQRETGRDRERQRETERDRERQGETERDRERDRERQRVQGFNLEIGIKSI